MLAPFLLMTLSRLSPGKVNFVLNILGRREDGYHELETVMYPIALCDLLHFKRAGQGIQLTCSDPRLGTGPDNLVFRAAESYLRAANLRDGVEIHLEKKIPIAAGLGGGSGNAATTLLALNEIFSSALTPLKITQIAETLGSDVPFFLQSKPALATGRGERIEPLDFFPALHGVSLVLIHPGFGISTAWAYQQLSRFPGAANGQPGRAAELVSRLQRGDLHLAGAHFYNSLEAPVLPKYPLLALFQTFLRNHGALAALMSGSGSTTFALLKEKSAAESALEKFKQHFGESCWNAVVEL